MTLRRTPADFIVTERLSAAAAAILSARPDAQHLNAVYELSKQSLTTPDAVSHLARALIISPNRLSYAGLKDKHAQTMQHVSASAPDAAAASRLPETVDGRGWRARRIGYTTAPICAEHIDGNQFEIMARDISGETSGEIGRRAGLLARDGSSKDALDVWIVNYFGDQRFGSARHGKGFVALALMAGDFESALRLAIATPARKDTGRTREFTRTAAAGWGQWKELAGQLPACPERRAIERLAAGGDFKDAFATLPTFLQAMYIEAYQSHLWNATARRLAWGLCEQAGVQPLRSDDTFGEMVFVPFSAIGDSWRSLNVPLLAPTTALTKPWGDAAKEVLRDEGVSLDQLRVPGLERPFFGEAPRQLFVPASGFVIGAPEPDDLATRPKRLKLRICFDLPRGAYATVVLRALGH